MNKAEFTKKYNALNEAQKKAVETIYGPVMVLAGPGTGKTTILTLRIANILLKTDIKPEWILALTFTESGVISMREKLLEIIGPDAYKVNIYTFHGFCSELIEKFPEKYLKIIGGTLASDAKISGILEEILQKEELKDLKPVGDQFFYLKELRSGIRSLKRENISPENLMIIAEQKLKDILNDPDRLAKTGKNKGKPKLESLTSERQVKKYFELSKIYSEYEKTLKEQKLFDFEDMILETIKALESDEDFLYEIKESYQFILADEHQDANQSQNKIIELLTKDDDSPNLFIVGDDKQAIFKFQGASLENFLYFKDKFPKTELIFLDSNYRSHQGVLDLSHSLIQKQESKKMDEIKLVSKNIKDKSPIYLIDCFNEIDETDFVSSKIKELIDQGTKPGEIAIIYRDNKDSVKFSSALRRLNIPFAIRAELDLLSHPDFLRFEKALKIVNDPSDEYSLSFLIALGVKDIDPLSSAKILRFAKDYRVKISDILFSEDKLKEIGAEDIEKIINFWKKILEIHKETKDKFLIEIIDKVLKNFGIINSVLDDPELYEERARTIHSLYKFASDIVSKKHSATATDLLEEIRLLRDYEIEIPVKNSFGTDKVNLMTAHRSKGLEYQSVFITSLVYGKWGNKKSMDKIGIKNLTTNETTDDDERRLLYVSMTRAKNNLFLSTYKADALGKEKMPSRFLSEIDETIIEKIKYKSDSNFVLKSILTSQGKEGLNLKKYIEEIFLSRSLSVTALNNYLRCSREYFFKNLLQVPSEMSNPQIYGSAFHKALEVYFKNGGKNEKNSIKKAEESFLQSLEKSPISLQNLNFLKQRGDYNLKNFLEYFSDLEPKVPKTEYYIQDLDFKLRSGKSIKLNGKLDLLDQDKNIVYDFKTTKHMSQKEIMGLTQNSDGGYYRQLCFYKLILDLEGKVFINKGSLVFAEQSQEKSFSAEIFDLDNSCVEKISQDINQMSENILGEKKIFNKCEEKDCEYCILFENTPWKKITE